MSKTINWGVTLLLAAGAAGGWYYWRKNSAKPAEYYTTSVSRGDLVQTVTATGVIKPTLDILVSSQVSGYISKIFVDFNSKVKAHQVIATLDPAFYQAQVESAEADLENADANAELQKITVSRDASLLAKNLLSQSEYDTAAALLGEANAQVKIKTAALHSARTNLSYTTIYSPIDGIVINRAVDVGNTVAASLSAPTLYEIANDLSKMQIDASVAEADIGNVREGQDVNFTVDAYPNGDFHGKVYQVRNAPQTQQNVVIYDVMISVSNEDLRLKPGMTANVSIVVARRAGALRVANSALRFRPPETPDFAPPAKQAAARKAERPAQPPDRPAGAGRGSGTPRAEAVVVRTVYVLAGGGLSGRPAPVRARLGITDGTNTEILGGLKEGNIVITGVSLSADDERPASSPFGGFRRGF